MVYLIKTKRENVRGKYRQVARQDGKIISSVKWSPKKSRAFYIKILKTNGTLSPKITRKRRVKVNEFFDMRDRPTINPELGANFFSEIRVNGEVIVHARSDHITNRRQMKKAREQADRRMFSILSKKIAGFTDEEVGREIVMGLIERGQGHIRRGIVRYSDI